MESFTTYVHVTGSARKMGDDKPYLQRIIQAVYANRAIVYRDWIGPAASRQRRGIRDEDANWTEILAGNVEAIQSSDLVIIEASQSRFSQGYYIYLAAQYKKPTLVVTRMQVEDHFISGVGGKYTCIKRYKDADELEEIVAKFIKKNSIHEKDLRFNFMISRRIYKYLRDKSYQTGKNKSEIIRELLRREANRHDH